ncbi:MAG: phosphoglycolate phosphatase [Hyphomicrobiaceae bacterium]|nr:phosphoglycolate phosphatase [Hyphomicrobiaceae bacterium]
MNKPAIIFDLDGTLVDTAPDLIHTLNHLLVLEDCPPAPHAQMRAMISLGAKAMLKKGFELADKAKNSKQLDELTQQFITHYSENIAVYSRPFPGVIKALDTLKNNGHPLGICTNKTEALSKQLINALVMEDFFGAIIGVDTLDVKKPDPGHILGTIKALGASPQTAIMVGDSETDIVAAKAANIPVIAVDFGYSIDPIANFAPDAIISTHEDLLLTLSSFFS